MKNCRVCEYEKTCKNNESNHGESWNVGDRFTLLPSFFSSILHLGNMEQLRGKTFVVTEAIPRGYDNRFPIVLAKEEGTNTPLILHIPLRTLETHAVKLRC